MFAADLALLGITLVWGVSFTITKDLLDALPTPALLALRFAVGAATLAALRPRALLAASPAAWRVGGVLGLVLYASFVLQTAGLARTTPARSAFLTAGYVFIVPLLAYLAGRERIGLGVGLGAALATFGLALLLGPEARGPIGWGDVLSALCAAGFAVHIYGTGLAARRIPPADLAMTQLVAATGAAFGGALASGSGGGLTAHAIASLDAGAWAGLGYLGAGCTALAYFVQTWGQRHTPAARTALIFSLEPAFAAAISVALGREQLGALGALGGTLVVAGVALAEALREPEPAPEANPSI